MQEIKYQNNAVPSEYLKPINAWSCALNEVFQKNFLHGVRNARNIFTSLERSIEKSNTYEDKLFRCRATHNHSHNFNEWPWEDFDDDKEFKAARKTKFETKKSNHQRRTPTVNLLESWSTMSIVCLQYQYEELSKRYEALLESFNEKCNLINAKNQTLVRLRQRARVLHAQLATAHRTLLSVGDKYLSLKKRRHELLQQCETKIAFLKGRVRDALGAAENARLHLDRKLSQTLALEPDSEYALLLVEMKKCNQLYLDNLKLKAQLDEYMPASVNWSKQNLSRK